MRLKLRFGRASEYVRRREWRGLLYQVGRAVYSDGVGVGIRLDLTRERSRASGSPDFRIRPATVEELRLITEPGRRKAGSADERWELRLRQHVVATLGADRGFVADVHDLGPSFMQYLFFAEDNDALQSLFPGMYPVLRHDEAMVEFLYVTPAARRYGAALHGMLQVTDEARRRGATSVLSFIRPDDKGVIYVCQSAGFKVDSLRRARHRLFRSTVTFEPRPEGMSETLSRLLSHAPQ